jgi:hypothetical protein
MAGAACRCRSQARAMTVGPLPAVPCPPRRQPCPRHGTVPRRHRNRPPAGPAPRRTALRLRHGTISGAGWPRAMWWTGRAAALASPSTATPIRSG